jgi:hypothetical protein
VKAEFRDKRYAGPALRVDLLERGHETGLWSVSELIVGIPDGPRAEGDKLSGVFTFPGASTHGLFDARLAKLDMPRSRMGVEFEWINASGLALLQSIIEARSPGELNNHPKMTVGFTHANVNWSLSGFLVADYHGPLETGQRFRGMIWMDKPGDPALFDGHAIRVNRERHTLSVKFDALPANSFALLEAAIGKSDIRVPRG